MRKETADSLLFHVDVHFDGDYLFQWTVKCDPVWLVLVIDVRVSGLLDGRTDFLNEQVEKHTTRNA